MKKILFAFFCFIILSGCVDQLNAPDSSGENRQPSPGMGFLTLSIAGGSSGRTILPAEDWRDSVKKLKLVFYYSETDTEAFEIFSEPGGGTFELEAGIYKLKLTAYTDDAMEKAVAWGEKNEVFIPEGDWIYVEIALSAKIDGIKDMDGNINGKGTFRWNIGLQLDTYFETAGMTIISQASAPPDLPVERSFSPDNSGAITGSIELKAGYYSVILSLDRNSSSIVLKKILHVYPNLESVFDDLIITEDHFGKSIYTVTFDHGYEDEDDEPVKTETFVLDGETVSRPANPERTGYVFDDWYSYTDFTEKYVFPAVITDNIFVYAGWKKLLTLEIPASVSGTLTPIDPVTFNVSISGLDNATHAAMVNLSITSPPGLQAGSPTGTFNINKKTYAVTAGFGNDEGIDVSEEQEIKIAIEATASLPDYYIIGDVSRTVTITNVNNGKNQDIPIAVKKSNIRDFNKLLTDVETKTSRI